MRFHFHFTHLLFIHSYTQVLELDSFKNLQEAVDEPFQTTITSLLNTVDANMYSMRYDSLLH